MAPLAITPERHARVPSSEAATRPDFAPRKTGSRIDRLLVACGWAVQDYRAVDFSEGRGTARRDKVKDRSQAGRFADLVSLVRFALEKRGERPVLEPFSDSVAERCDAWLRAKQSGTGVPPFPLPRSSPINSHGSSSCAITSPPA